jgi:CBS domain-containing protein
VAILCFGSAAAGRLLGVPEAAVTVADYLGTINLALVLFNMVPAFPLDGGRMLRAVLWGWKDDIRWATKLGSRIGSAFGAVLIGLGLLSLLLGRLVGGIWWIMIGMFLRQAARGAYRQLLIRRSLEGEPVRRFMNPNAVAVPRQISVQQLVEDFVYHHHFKMYPVVDGERLIGCVTTRDIKELARDQWRSQTVGAIAAACDDTNTVRPDDDAMDALAKFNRARASRLLVVDRDRLLGVLSLKDLLGFFSMKMELGDA